MRVRGEKHHEVTGRRALCSFSRMLGVYRRKDQRCPIQLDDIRYLLENVPRQAN